jgi:hypothetical protein
VGLVDAGEADVNEIGLLMAGQSRQQGHLREDRVPQEAL